MTPAPPPAPSLPKGMYALAAMYFVLAGAAGAFAALQLAEARSFAQNYFAPSRGDELPQGKTEMGNGDVYERDGNHITFTAAGSNEPRGWYVGNDPRAAGGTVGRGPGRVSREYLIGVGVAVAGCCAIGACCLVPREWAWRFVYSMQMLVGAFGGVCAIFWLTVALWLFAAGGKNVGIGLMIAPPAIGLELAVVTIALFALWYLQRPAVRAAFGVVDLKRSLKEPRT